MIDALDNCKQPLLAQQVDFFQKSARYSIYCTK